MRPARPILLDFFCCEGGAARGYHDAGFDVIGFDLEPQPRYPFEFRRGDAIETLWEIAASGARWDGYRVSAVHASPPCQAHSDLQKQSKIEYSDLIVPTRRALEVLSTLYGIPYVIENVEGAPLRDPVKICGAGIPGLRVIRHRLFESNVELEGVDCPRDADGNIDHPLVFTHDKRKAHYGRLDQNTSYVQVTGGGNCTVANKRAAMGTPWMSGHGCNEAIPPAYTEFIGRQLMEVVRGG